MSAVTVTIDADGIALVVLNRPDRLNALNPELIATMISSLGALAIDDAVKAIVVTGSGRGFCAGADLVSFLSQTADASGTVGQQVADSMERGFNPMMVALMDFPKPVVSAVNGIAAGGGAAMALCADIVVAGRSAVFKFVQVPQLGCVADLGGNWLLSRLAGRAVALGAVLLGGAIDAARAERLGLIWEVVEDAALIRHATVIARTIAAAPRGIALASRRLVDASAAMGFREFLDLERLYQNEFCSRPELVETIARFMAAKTRAT